ncbi:MAG: hypothetical protein EOO30_08425 [Comamonadaceae bacterium]|nr:MAG: hypothetical protein EOO30_08425 [Comamonadaceae bacterium]
MGFVRLLIFLGLIGFIIHWWGGRQAAPAATAGMSAEESSPGGFIPAAMPDGAPPNTVVILAPLHCSSEEAQRAESLAGELERLRIPVLRSSQYSATSDGSDSTRQANVKRAVTVLNGEVPAVFVNGRAKANPSADEVIAEYQRAR